MQEVQTLTTTVLIGAIHETFGFDTIILTVKLTET